MKIEIEVEFEIGQSVFMRACDDQEEYIVTSYEVSQGVVKYGVSNGKFIYVTFAFELSEKANEFKKLGLKN